MTAYALAARTQRMTTSAIRDLLKVLDRPGMISLAGGMPAAELFPVEPLRLAADRVMRREPRPALQYAPTEGDARLRTWVASHLGGKCGTSIDPARVMIVSGSQQAIDLVARVLLDEGSPLLVDDPTFIGALMTFAPYEPRYVTVASDRGGMLPDAFAHAARGARMAYVMPNFQNPTGRTLAVERRRALVETARAHGVWLVEDDPYGELRYEGEALPPLLSFDPEHVIHMGTFSKVLAPGFRLGYIIAPPRVQDKLLMAKQAADLHTSRLSQLTVAEFLASEPLAPHLELLRATYRARRDAIVTALHEHVPELRIEVPAGGMFVWAEAPANIDAKELLDRAIEHGVAFVQGAPFFAGPPRRNTLRLSFVTVDETAIRIGIERLAAALRELAAAR
jgi:2-aminoadipate transaminase